MPTNQQNQSLFDRIAALRETLVNQLAPDLIQNPQLAEALDRQLDDLLQTALAQQGQTPPPPDGGLSALVGLGPNASSGLASVEMPQAVDTYDETVTSERILGVGDLYYIYQHEKVGVFRAVLKLQELFKAGTVRLSSGDGAYGLYRFDRRQVLRYTQRDRMQAYRRVFGYTNVNPPAGAQPNTNFHTLLVNFASRTAHYFSDQRIAQLIRSDRRDPGIGSIAIVRRAGLDLRNSLKSASYGHVNVLRIEVMQLLDEAFQILGTNDIRSLFGADNAWDVVEEVMRRYLNRPQINASQRSRMAVAGREMLRWLAQPYILNSTRVEIEALLRDISEEAEEWLTSAETMGALRAANVPRSVSAPAVARPAPAAKPSREALWAYELN
jgi:hypothetical protein